MYFNPAVVKTLNKLQVDKGYTSTVITSLSAKKVIELLVNPESIEVESTINSQTIDTFIFEKVMVNSKKITPIKFSAILLNCVRYKLSLDSYLLELQQLLIPKNNKFERYSIVVGKKAFSPVIFTSLRILDSLRLGGETVTASVELSGVIENSTAVLEKGLNR
jgi:hypothetical protein